MTTRCSRCGHDNDEGPGMIVCILLIMLGLAAAIGFFQFCAYFRWLCGWGG